MTEDNEHALLAQQDIYYIAYMKPSTPHTTTQRQRVTRLHRLSLTVRSWRRNRSLNATKYAEGSVGCVWRVRFHQYCLYRSQDQPDVMFGYCNSVV